MTRMLDELVWMRKVVAEGRAADIRTRAGLTQKDIGDAVGCSAATICRWETATKRPSGLRARRYAAVLSQLARQVQ